MPRRELPYSLLDVFTERPFSGNQLAVFARAAVDDVVMQRIARELNLSETVFLEPDGAAAASLRIFTPYHEMRFAGHPTIGAALALALELRWISDECDRFHLALPIGAVPIDLERGPSPRAWLTTPPVRFGIEFDAAAAAAMAGVAQADVRGDLPCGFAGADRPFLYVGLRDEAAVDQACVVAEEVKRRAGWADINGLYVYALTPHGAYSRMFAPMSGIAEDPATGSAAGPLAALLDRRGTPSEDALSIRQGVAMGRESELHVRRVRDPAGAVSYQVGGSAVFAGRGVLFVDA